MLKRVVGIIVWYLALPVLIIVVWKAADIAGYIVSYTMPPPEDIVYTAVEFYNDGTLLEHIKASFIRVLEGFAIALVLALILGVAIGLNRHFERFVDSSLQIIKPIPPIAWIPLAILWFGIGEASKIYIIAVGAFFPILVNTIEGIKNIDNRYLELARVYEVQRGRIISHVILPGALPFIIVGVRLGLGMGWICVVAAELIAANSGIGYMLMDGRSLSRPDIVILGMIMIGVTGKIMDDVLRFISAKIIKWN
ncbi:MAG: ABC transporter permease [Campylobacteraceae bacterium]|jgi:sulfonate transport system permease protein|nr:ABC transporter permease [Campylobacteraceae bacterium]